MYFLEIGLF